MKTSESNSLNLRSATMEGEPLSHIVARMINPAIKHLDISDNDITEDDLEFLFLRNTLKGIESIELENCAIGDKGVEVLCKSNHLSNVRSIKLCMNHITDEGMKHFTNACSLNKLSQVSLYWNPISIYGLTRWLDSAQVTQLESLYLGRYRLIKNTQFSQILTTQGLYNLKHLSIPYSSIGPETIRVLSKSPQLSRLGSISLWANPIQIEGVHHVLNNLNVEKLDISSCFEKKPSELNRIFSHREIKKLRALDAGNNMLEDGFIYSFVNSKKSNRLSSLNVSGNLITDKAIAYLFKGRNIKSLKTLDVAHNELTDESANIISRSSALLNLDSLNITGNKISEKGLEALFRSLYLSLSMRKQLEFGCITKKGVSESPRTS